MIQALITAAVCCPLIFYIDKKRNGIIEGFTVISFVVVPALIILLLTVGGGFLGLPGILLLPLQLLYLLVPLLMSRYQLDYSWGVASAYGGIVFGGHVLISIIFIVIFGGVGNT